MLHRPRPLWLLVGANAVFAALLASMLFAGLLPARERASRLEAELREVYAREAALQTRLVQAEQRRTAEVRALRAERNALARRLADLQRRSGERRR